jgi:hypothetical protein
MTAMRPLPKLKPASPHGPTSPHGNAGAARCAAISETMIGHFTTRLEVEAKKAGGSLSGDAIRAIAERFLTEEHGRFAPAFQRSFDDCSRFREATQWDAARRRPFDRILIRRFAHLFPARHGDDGGDNLLSRRMLPGFAQAIDKVIGPTLYEQCHHKAIAIVERHRHPGGGLDWDAVHDDGEAIALTNDVLAVVAHAFGDFEHRRRWFLHMVNNHLAPAEDCSLDPRWTLSDHGFTELMRALFTELRIAMAKTPDQLRRRYGEDTCQSLTAFLRKL